MRTGSTDQLASLAWHNLAGQNIQAHPVRPASLIAASTIPSCTCILPISLHPGFCRCSSAHRLHLDALCNCREQPSSALSFV